MTFPDDGDRREHDRIPEHLFDDFDPRDPEKVAQLHQWAERWNRAQDVELVRLWAASLLSEGGTQAKTQRFLEDTEQRSILVYMYALTRRLETVCGMLGLNAQVVRNKRDQDKTFRKELEAAERWFADNLLAEVHQRALKGWEEVSVKHERVGPDGEMVETERVRRTKIVPALLLRLAEEYIPEWKKDRDEKSVSKSPVVALPGMIDKEEWKKRAVPPPPPKAAVDEADEEETEQEPQLPREL